MQWLLIVFSALLGGAVLSSYALVLGNVGNAFPLANTTFTSYIDSPYWLGLRRDTIVGLIVLQVFAGIGYISWFVWLVTTNVERGLLQTPLARFVIIALFLSASIAWPYAAHNMVARPSQLNAVGAAACLWLAAAAIVAAVGGTFEAGAPAYATVGILLLGQVVVLADGAGWAAVAIYRHI